jgi:hypothetical protein
VALDLESEVDRLYGVELDDFVRERTELARALRKEGRREEAASVQELRKPTISAWTVNQLARRKRKEVDLLLDAGHRLATAQADLVAGGDRAGFAKAREREQDALERLRRAAREVLGDRAAEGTLERVSTTLRTAAVSEEGRELLALGRLTADLEPGGFDAFAAIAPVSPPGRAPKPPAPTRREERAAEEEAKGREKERVARREQAAARREAIERARQTLSDARERERELAKQARAAQQALADARRSLEKAEHEAEAIEAERRAAADALEAAKRAFDAARSER